MPQPRKTRTSSLVSHGLVLLWPLLLVGATACHPPRTLETRFGTRLTESLQARAERIQEGWRVSLPLPAGNWKVEPFEAQAFDLVPGEPSATLQWTVVDARWANFQKPFVFELVDTEGRRLPMTIRYPQPTLLSNVVAIGEELLLLASSSATSEKQRP